MPNGDALFWKQFKAGDAQAFEHLAAQHYRALYNYGLKFSKDSEFIRDCIQELLLELWAHRETLSQTEFVKAYLLKAFRHKILKETARLARFHGSDEDRFEAEPVPTAEHHLIRNEEEALRVERVRRTIAALPRRQQEIIYLKFYQQLDAEEIARVMNLNRQGVANLLYRALKELRTHWPEASWGLLAALVQQTLGG